MIVKIKKKSASKNPAAETSTDKDVNKDFSDPEKSIWSGYEVICYALDIPKKDEHCCLKRIERNGIKVDGIFRTSCVINVEKISDKEYIFETFNSIYHLEILQK